MIRRQDRPAFQMCVLKSAGASGPGTATTGASVPTARSMHSHSSPFFAGCFRFGLGFYSSNEVFVDVYNTAEHIEGILSSLPPPLIFFLPPLTLLPALPSFLSPTCLPSLFPSPLISPLLPTSSVCLSLCSALGILIKGPHSQRAHSPMEEAEKKTDHRLCTAHEVIGITHRLFWGHRGDF